MSAAPATSSGRRRCFLALLPDAASRAALVHGRSFPEYALAAGAHGVRWTAPEALHLTLRFLGDSDAAQVEGLRKVLPALACPLPALPGRRYGIWPNRARPRMLVLEVGSDPMLARLASACEAEARTAGFPPEQRAFRAHITLARLRPGCAFGIAPDPRIALRFDRIALMESTLGRTVAVYTALASVPLPPAAGEGVA